MSLLPESVVVSPPVPRRAAGPAPQNPDSSVVRNQTVSVKLDGFGGYFWKEKWLVLEEQTLNIYKNEVSLRNHFPSFDELTRSLCIVITSAKRYSALRYRRRRAH
jgi:hypothetical protein